MCHTTSCRAPWRRRASSGPCATSPAGYNNDNTNHTKHPNSTTYNDYNNNNNSNTNNDDDNDDDYNSCLLVFMYFM